MANIIVPQTTAAQEAAQQAALAAALNNALNKSVMYNDSGVLGAD